MFKSVKELKLSKTSRVFLSTGILVVILGSLGLTRSQQIGTQKKLDEELSLAQMRIDKLPTKQLQQQKEELERKLEESLSQLDIAKESLQQPVESDDVIEEFFAIADSCRVGIANIAASNIRTSQLENVDCRTILINSSVKGKLPNLIDFVISLNNDFTTGIVNTVGISIQEETEDGNSSASVQMEVNTYKGD